MVDITVTSDANLDSPTLVEGLPGVGLVGKIAADHMKEELEMEEYGSVRSEGLPPVSVFEAGNREVKSPVRLFVDEAHDLLALHSAVPIEVLDEQVFVEELTEWVAEVDATPIYLAGIAEERDPGDAPEVYGISTGAGGDLLSDAGVEPPTETGLIQGPGGALLQEAKDRDVDAVGLLVESDPRFPDPQGAQRIIDRGIEPIAGVEVDTGRLSEEAEDIVSQRESMMQQMQQAEERGDQVSTRGMFR